MQKSREAKCQAVLQTLLIISSVTVTLLVATLSLALLIRILLPLKAHPSQPSLPLKLSPPLHRNLARVKLALILDASLLNLAHPLGSGLACVAPGEVVEFPVGVDWEDEVPDREGD